MHMTASTLLTTASPFPSQNCPQSPKHACLSIKFDYPEISKEEQSETKVMNIQNENLTINNLKAACMHMSQNVIMQI
jgi:hypothetical protein